MNSTRKRLKPTFSVTDDELNESLDYDRMCGYWEAHARAIAMMAAASDVPMTIHYSAGQLDLSAMTRPDMKGTTVRIHAGDKSPDAIDAPGSFVAN